MFAARRGLTLLEIVVSLALLTSIMLAAMSLVRMANRGVASVATLESETLGRQAVVRLLRDDLRTAVRLASDDDQEIVLFGVDAISGQRMYLRWSIDDAGVIRREQRALAPTDPLPPQGSSSPRVVWTGQPGDRLVIEESGQIWWLLTSGVASALDLGGEGAAPPATAGMQSVLVWGAEW